MSTYGISFIGDDALATGHEFAFVDMGDDGGWIFYRESALSPQSLEDSWSAYRALLSDADPEPDPGEGSGYTSPLVFRGRPELEAVAPRQEWPEWEFYLRAVM